MAIERAVEQFVKEVDVKGADVGFFNQSIESIANATFLNRGGDFWLVEEDGEVAAYLLGSISKDVDNTLVYWLTQSWVSKNYRGKKCVKEWFAEIREHAKRSLCRHLILVSGRGAKAYCRWLGNGLHTYATLLIENF